MTQISEVLPLGDDGKYRLQDIFRYDLDDGDEGDGQGALAWTGARSVFAPEPKIRILRPKWDLTKPIFQSDVKTA